MFLRGAGPRRPNPSADAETLRAVRWAARWLHEDDPDWFEGGCGDVAVLLEAFARVRGMPGVHAVGGTAGAADDPVPHAWLDVGGRRYDPRADVEGLRYATYAPGAPEALDFLVLDWPEDDDWRLAALLRAWDGRGSA